jgi:hypothetical protein
MSTVNSCIVNNILYAIFYDMLNIAVTLTSMVIQYCKQYFVCNIV